MRGLVKGTTHLLSLLLGLMFLGSEALRSSQFTFLGEQRPVTSNDVMTISTSSPTSQPPDEKVHNNSDAITGTESSEYETNTEQMNITEADNTTTIKETEEEKIKGRLGPHNTPMGTPSHSKGIAFIDDEKEHYKCYSCKGKACALTQTSDSRMCNTTRRTCWMTFTMADGTVTRGCSSPGRSIKCTDTYPNGFITEGRRCSFCCTDNLCNWHVLMNSTCVGINAQSSAQTAFPLVPLCLMAIAFKLLRHYY